MKKVISILLICLLLFSLTGCGEVPGSERLEIICTVFPQYDWVRNIIGDTEGVELTLLMDNGADLHNYQASVADLTDISACDLFIYIGGESDEWAEDALKDPINKDRKTLALLDVIEPLCADHDHDHEEEEHEHEHEEYDEHLWLSLKNAETAVEKITDLLAELDPENATAYAANSAAYRAKLGLLERNYQAAVDGAKRKTLLFADRFPFSYLARDYGLTHYAAFSGCSAETEASFATITMLTQKVDELELPAVMVIETSDQSIAKTVIQNSKSKNQEIVVMDSLQSVTQKRIDEGETYLGIMEKNLTALKKALY